MNESNPGTHEDTGDDAFLQSLENLSLTELQDVFGHLDRDRYPERIEAVRNQMHIRIEQLKHAPQDGGTLSATVSGPFRRLWGSLLDIFVSLFPLVLYVGLSKVTTGGGGGGGGGGRGGRGGGGRGGRGRGRQEPEEAWYEQVVDFLTSPDEILAVVETYGPYVLGFVIYRALYSLPQMVQSGALPGMREAGCRVVSEDGSPLTYGQAGKRFVSAYLLGFLTLGISHLWAFRDPHRRTLFDRIAGTRVVRLPRRWEKPPEQRILED